MSPTPDEARGGSSRTALPGSWTSAPAAVAPARDGRTRDPLDDPDVLARVAWSVLVEPGDAVAGAVVAALGAPEALAWAAWAVTATPSAAARGLRVAVRRVGARPGGARTPDGGAGTGRTVGTGGTAGADTDSPGDMTVSTRVLSRVLPRWAPRLAGLEPRRALEALAAVEGAVLVPGRPGWPERLDDLGHAAPMLLWVRGEHDLRALLHRSVALVGARAATAYGQHVAVDLGRGLASGGVTVVSGGAFGIDAAAHRGAVLAGGPTVAFLAGGVDRPSPAGNLDLLDRMRCEGGALVAESPPGTPPTRSRFLLRNRLIAAVTGATVVVEAAWRSGALSTAARAAELLRPVGAVPGPVTSMASAGCHRLLRDAGAVCVTDASEVAELLGPAAAPGPGGAGGPGGLGGPGDDMVAPGGLVDEAAPGGRSAGPGGGVGREVSRGDRGTGGPSGAAGQVSVDPTDRADSTESRVLDALHRRRVGSVLDVARRAGLGERETATTLGLLELSGVVEHASGGWRRCAEP